MNHEELDKQAQKDIKKIVKEYGWYIALFEADTATPAFGYTIGLWKNFNHPEIISFGLPTETLHEILNTAADMVKQGQKINLNVSNDEILEGFPVQFKQVHSTNIADYFGYGLWYNDYKEFPAIQLIWPDNNSNYMWDSGYAETLKFNQPLLEDELDFKFFEEKNVAVFSVKQVFDEKHPILYVSHDDDDGAWQFLPGFEVGQEDVMVVALEQVTKLDPTINELFNLPTGYYATRKSIEDKWVRHQSESED